MSARKRMGCVPSIPGGSIQGRESIQPWKPMQRIETVVQAYMRLDGAIAKAETIASAAHLAALLPLMQSLQQELAKVEENLANPLIPTMEDPVNTMLEIISNLGLAKEPTLATEHEEFVANINRQTIYSINQILTEKEFTEITNKKSVLEGEVAELQIIYKELDALLDRALGAQYSSITERELEARLGGARALRDTMAVAASGWIVAMAKARKAQTNAEQALASWQLIAHSSSLQEKVRLGVECLQATLEGTCTLRCIKSLLPSVHFPHCTVRQLQALSLTLEYMFTDMFNQERFNHATRVLTGFAERTLALATWITEVMMETLNTTLHKDLEEIDASVNEMSNELRTIRVNMMAEKGLTDVVYQSPDPKDLLTV